MLAGLCLLCQDHTHDALQSLIMDARYSTHYLRHQLLHIVQGLLDREPISNYDVRLLVRVAAVDIVHLLYSWSRDRVSTRCQTCLWIDATAGHDQQLISYEQGLAQQARNFQLGQP